MKASKAVRCIVIVATFGCALSNQFLSVRAGVPPKTQEVLQGIAWVQVPAGSLRVGEAPDREIRTLAHPLTISATPITNRQYARFLTATGRAAPVFPSDSQFIRFIHTLAPQFVWHGTKSPRGFEEYPVAFINRDGAQAYCQWLSQQTGRVYRLPRRAELAYCLTVRPRTAKDIGIYPQWYDPKWLGDFVAWYGLSAVTGPGTVTAQEKDWGKPIQSRFNLKYYPQSLMEWTDDGVVGGSGWSSAQAQQTHLFPMHASGVELRVLGLRVVAENLES